MISDQTVGNILKRHGTPPAPQRKKTVTWREFTRIHLDVLGATDFFTSNVWRWFGLIISSLCCCIHVSRDHVYAVGTTLHPPRQRLRSFGRRALDWSAHVQSWDHWGRQISQSPAIRCGEGAPVSPVSAGALSHQSASLSQEMGKAVVLSDASPRRIRDGPMPHRHQFDGLLKYDGRQAA